MYLFFSNFIQCCNLNNFGSNEYNFEGGIKSKRNSALERMNEASAKDLKVKHQATKTNMNLNIRNSKTLILEMETENHEKKDKIIITPTGLIDSIRNKREENENTVYFGYKLADEIVIKILYNMNF